MALFDVLAEPELYRYLPHDPPTDAGVLEERFSRLTSRRSPDGRQQWLNWAVRERARGEAVGLVEVTVEGKQAHLAYFVARSQWRQGIAYEACGAVLEHLREDLRVTEATAEIDTRNIASYALAESLGFIRTALHRDADVIDGQPSHEYKYRLNLAGPHSPPHTARASDGSTPD